MNSPLATPTAPSASIEGSTILIIDDIPADLDLLVEHLEKQAYRVLSWLRTA